MAMKRREGVHTGARSRNVLGRFVWSVLFSFVSFSFGTQQVGMVIGVEMERGNRSDEMVG